MAFGNNFTSEDALLKEVYSDEEVEKALFEDNTWLGMVEKEEDLSGRVFVQDIVYGAGQGRAATFSNALAQSSLTGENVAQFKIAPKVNHAVANVSAELVSATKNDAGAFLKAVTLIADDQLSNFSLDLGISMYRTSAGARGQVSTGTTLAGHSLTLAQPDDILNFEVGMELSAAAAESSGNARALGSAGHGLYVSAVNYDTYTLTIATTPVPGGTPVNMNDATDGIPNIDHGDYLYVTGDRNAKWQGFKDWIVYGGPSATAFCGVDRTANPTRLAGRYIDGTAGSSITSLLEDAIAKVHTVGGKLTHFLMTPKMLAQLSKELGAKTQLVDVSSTNAKVGYRGIEIAGGKGSVICLSDRCCPPDLIAGVNMKTWKLRTDGKAAHLWQVDGKVWLRKYNDAGMEVRFYSWGHLACKSPRDNINIKVTPA